VWNKEREADMANANLRLIEGHSMDKSKALDAALSQIERAFGKGSVMRLGKNESPVEIATVPTGSLGLDIALGIGGLPRGRIVEIYGPESSGKTTLALHAIAEARVPFIMPAGRVKTRLDDDVATIALDVDARPDAAVALDVSPGMGKDDMAATAAGDGFDGMRERSVLIDELLQRLGPAIAWIDIEDYPAADSPRWDSDVGVRPAFPPMSDCGFIGGGVLETMISQRMLAGLAAMLPAFATARSLADRVAREHGQSLLCVPQRRVQHGW
jgi:hypothetical protein